MPQLQAMWAKLNANERLVTYGAIIVLIAWLVSLVGGGGLTYGFITAIIVLVIYWLKYAPNQTITAGTSNNRRSIRGPRGWRGSAVPGMRSFPAVICINPNGSSRSTRRGFAISFIIGTPGMPMIGRINMAAAGLMRWPGCATARGFWAALIWACWFRP